MGNGNSSTITINLDRNNLFYFTDETVSGTVEFDVKGTVEADEIYMQLTGDIGYTTDRTIQDTNDNISTQHKLILILFHFILVKLFLHNLKVNKKKLFILKENMHGHFKFH